LPACLTSRKSRNGGNIIAFLILLDDHVKTALEVTFPFNSKRLCTLTGIDGVPTVDRTWLAWPASSTLRTAAEVDPILLFGIDRANRCQRDAIDGVLSALPGKVALPYRPFTAVVASF
jgi:hypothetical protein